MADEMENRCYELRLRVMTAVYPSDKDSTIQKAIMMQFREEDFPYIVGDEEAEMQVKSGSIRRIK